MTEEVVKLLELKLYVRNFVSFWCLCISEVYSDSEVEKNTEKYLGSSLSPFINLSIFSCLVHLHEEEMLHLAFREKVCVFSVFLITKKPIPNKTEHLEEANRAQTFAILCYLLACINFSSLLLKYYCVLHRAAMMNGIFQSFNKAFWNFNSCLFHILQADFKLMCDNAMTYNRPDTVYYKLAKKILHTGFKMMSKVRDLLKTKSRNSLGVVLPYLKGTWLVTIVSVMYLICD